MSSDTPRVSAQLVMPFQSEVRGFLARQEVASSTITPRKPVISSIILLHLNTNNPFPFEFDICFLIETLLSQYFISLLSTLNRKRHLCSSEQKKEEEEEKETSGRLGSKDFRFGTCGGVVDHLRLFDLHFGRCGLFEGERRTGQRLH